MLDLGCCVCVISILSYLIWADASVCLGRSVAAMVDAHGLWSVYMFSLMFFLRGSDYLRGSWWLASSGLHL